MLKLPSPKVILNGKQISIILSVCRSRRRKSQCFFSLLMQAQYNLRSPKSGLYHTIQNLIYYSGNWDYFIHPQTDHGAMFKVSWTYKSRKVHFRTLLDFIAQLSNVYSLSKVVNKWKVCVKWYTDLKTLGHMLVIL